MSRLLRPGIGAGQRSHCGGAEIDAFAVLGCKLIVGTIVLALVGDEAALDEQEGELIALATEQGLPLYIAGATVHHGWIMVKNGKVAEGISVLRSGLIPFSAAGQEQWIPIIPRSWPRRARSQGKLKRP